VEPVTSDALKIAIIVGSTRPGRIGASVAQWVSEQAQGRSAAYDLVDLADFDLDLLNEPTVPGAAGGVYENPKTTRWSEAIQEYDGFVFVTPEYNHGVPAALKNAVDVLYPEWNNKGAALVSYGADAGVRAVEQWRQILANVFLHVTRGQMSIRTFEEFEDGRFVPAPRRPEQIHALLDQLEALTAAVKSLR
jgi:NAD(P)H-dependent FMN reductase